jgi:tetratricopeptide (TPR) repeat protein
MGETGFLSTSAGFIGDVLARLGRFEEAERMADLAEETAAADDFSSQELWRRIRARIASHHGEHDRALALARAGVALCADTDYTTQHAEARMTLAEVLDAAGRTGEALQEARRAGALYEDKGAAVMVERTRARIADLAGGVSSVAD